VSVLLLPAVGQPCCSWEADAPCVGAWRTLPGEGACEAAVAAKLQPTRLWRCSPQQHLHQALAVLVL
jgi:hypothetical protein